MPPQWSEANCSLMAARFCEKLNIEEERALNMSHNTVTKLSVSSVRAVGILDADACDDPWGSWKLELFNEITAR